jgi:hypothetical protein
LLPYVLAAVTYRKETKPSSRYPKDELRIIKAAFKQSLEENPVYAGYTVETQLPFCKPQSDCIVMLSTEVRTERLVLEINRFLNINLFSRYRRNGKAASPHWPIRGGRLRAAVAAATHRKNN